MVKRRDIVTDHAVVRYLERVYGVDIVALKRRIERTTEGGREQGANAVLCDGVRYRLSQNGRVVTVIGQSGVISNRGKRWKARRK